MRTQHGINTLQASKLHYSNNLDDVDRVDQLVGSFFSHMMARNMGPSEFSSNIASNNNALNTGRIDKFVSNNQVTNPTVQKIEDLNDRP